MIRLMVFEGSSSQLEVTSLWNILIAKSFEGQFALHQECKTAKILSVQTQCKATPNTFSDSKLVCYPLGTGVGEKFVSYSKVILDVNSFN